MKKYKVKVEKLIEVEDEADEADALMNFISWFYDADSNAEILVESDEVEVEEVKQ